MPLPTEPVTLSVEQIGGLNQKLADLRHDINNHVSVILASAELLQHHPENTGRMLTALTEHPQKIIAAITQFSHELEAALRVTRS